MLITDRTRLRGRALEEVASQAVEGGVNVVQLREKDLSSGEVYDLAITLRAVLRGRALLLVNDRIDVAIASGADGTHLPEHGVPAKWARRIAGEECIIGRSVHSVEAALRAEAEGGDYVQVGTIFETATHLGRAPAGVELVQSVADAVRVPVVAVGGVNAGNLREALAAGATGVAVVGAILDADDPARAASELCSALHEAYEVA
jgi:thiamine-phosphate pyrophosphorylase